MMEMTSALLPLLLLVMTSHGSSHRVHRHGDREALLGTLSEGKGGKANQIQQSTDKDGAHSNLGEGFMEAYFENKQAAEEEDRRHPDFPPDPHSLPRENMKHILEEMNARKTPESDFMNSVEPSKHSIRMAEQSQSGSREKRGSKQELLKSSTEARKEGFGEGLMEAYLENRQAAEREDRRHPDFPPDPHSLPRENMKHILEEMKTQGEPTPIFASIVDAFNRFDKNEAMTVEKSSARQVSTMRQIRDDPADYGYEEALRLAVQQRQLLSNTLVDVPMTDDASGDDDEEDNDDQ